MIWWLPVLKILDYKDDACRGPSEAMPSLISSGGLSSVQWFPKGSCLAAITEVVTRTLSPLQMPIADFLKGVG